MLPTLSTRRKGDPGHYRDLDRWIVIDIILQRFFIKGVLIGSIKELPSSTEACSMFVQRFRLSTPERVFRAGNYLFLALLAGVTLYPFWFIIQASFTDPLFRMSLLWPKGAYYGNYWLVFNTEGIGRAYFVTEVARIGSRMEKPR